MYIGKVGKHSKRVDAALPGKHTRQLYEDRPWKERNMLAQLRTDMSVLNNSLYRVRQVASDKCACGREQESVPHFLFRCNKWTRHRRELSNARKRNEATFHS